VRKSFDFSPLAILIQAGLTSDPKGNPGRIQRCKSHLYNGLRFEKGNSTVVLECAGMSGLVLACAGIVLACVRM
jgi:hypothetical protein